jgi:hypothetical protein
VSASRLFEVLLDDEILDLPESFFYDRDGIFSAIESGVGAGTINLPGAIQVSGATYKSAVMALDVLVDDGGTIVRADTSFCFTVPERAFEDTAVISGLMVRGALSPRLALCCVMVDFSNPVFSPRRAALLGYFPNEIALGPNGGPLDAAVEAAIRGSQASSMPSSPEAEFLTWWDSGDLFELASETLRTYMHSVQQRATTLEGVIDILKLADSRREAFRGRSLNEFRHTTARNGALVSLFEMDAAGNIAQKTTSEGEGPL